MPFNALSIRPFIGAKDYDISRGFYGDLGFEERILSPELSLFINQHIAFYLQKAYIKEWIDNTMIFVQVDDVDASWADLVARDLPGKYPGARLRPIRSFDWGRECFLHDPSGVLWHFGQFSQQ